MLKIWNTWHRGKDLPETRDKTPQARDVSYYTERVATLCSQCTVQSVAEVLSEWIRCYLREEVDQVSDVALPMCCC